jgi:2-polyprenyl-3-methyl-5-hydroxy-6-metoxy-1,4-benzoquinol methylase
MTGLEFTDEAARQLEKAYLTRDVIAQRSETIRHLRLSRGESILDIGCGPGRCRPSLSMQDFDLMARPCFESRTSSRS